jgi:hypothetical protein
VPESSTSVAPTVPAPPAPHTHLQAGIQNPKVYFDGIVRYTFSASSTEPHSLQEALSTPCWTEAMHDEYTSLMRNKTCHLVPPQPGRNIINCKWVYKGKQKADGSVDRYKAHLVVKGFKQRLGIGYNDMFSLVVKPTTI